MPKRFLLLFIVVLVMVPVPAVAQEADIPVADLEPLATIIDVFASTDDFGDLFLTNEAAEATVLSQFQILVNMGRDPAFGEEDMELVFSGVTTSDIPELVSVEEYFPQGATFRMLPPLAPFEDRNNGFDPATLADGWLIFGEEGPIEDSPIFFEQFQTVWGIELAEPFDTACSTTSYVGRAWNGASVTTGPDPLFTQDAIDPDHAALAGQTTRYAELACFKGSEPIVGSRRMKEGAGARIFGPTGTIALVKDRFVVFFSPVRIYDGDLSQFFYASPPEGGPVEVSSVDAPLPLLVPNPYEELNSRITIVPSTAQGSSFSGDDTGRTLLHTPGDPTASTAQSSGSGCPLPGDIFVNDLVQGAAGSGFIREVSTYTKFSPSFGVVSLSFMLVTGSEITMELDIGRGTIETRITSDASSASSPSCTRSDTFLIDGESPAQAAGQDPAPEDPATTGTTGEDPATGTAAPEAAADDTSDDGSGIPWVPIGIALILLAGVAAVVARSRTRTKGCVPEEQAYAAALAAYDPALAALQAAEDARHAAAMRAAELEGTAGFRLPKPVLGYDPEPGKAEAILDEQMTEWTAQGAAADEAEADLGEARSALAEAESHRAEAESAFITAKDTLEAARLALAACKGSAPAARSDEVGTSPPPVVPIPPQQPATTTPDEPDKKKCADGDTNRRRLNQQRFTILAGTAEVSVPTAQWNAAFAGGKLSPSALAAISFDELTDYFEDLDHRQSAVTVRVTIPTVVVTVSCFQNLVCRSDEWVETGDVERVEERTPGDDIVFVHKSKDKKLTARMVEEAQAKIAELQANKDDPSDFTCD